MSFKRVVEISCHSSSWLSHFVSSNTIQTQIAGAYPLLRRLVQHCGVKNPCLLLSLSGFAMAPKGSCLLISALDSGKDFKAHAWIKLQNGIVLTTDQSFTNNKTFTFEK